MFSNRLRTLWRLLCLALCMVLLPAAWAGKVSYPGFYVFGDSLSDTGNDYIVSGSMGMTPAIPPSATPYATYWQGRFSNGPVAAEYLWRLMARKNNAELSPSVTDPTLSTKPALSFAFGGSASGVSTPTPMGFTVPGLLGQVGQFTTALNGRKAPATALYMVWSGANDYLQMLTSDPYTVVANVTTAIRGLYVAGARDFIVPNLADMGITPFAVAQNAGPQFTALSQQHNALLKTALGNLGRELRGARIVTVDVYKLGATMLSTGLIIDDVPAAEFLAPGKGAATCLFTNPATCVDVTQPAFMPPFLFWDAMHPTTQVHGVIGTAMFAALLTQR
jgi:phospholipase/lecithinase/hemolysin